MSQRSKRICSAVLILLVLSMLLCACKRDGKEPAPGTTGGNDPVTDPFGEHTAQYLSEVCKLSAEHQISSVADSLIVGDAASESAHGLTLRGAVKKNMTAATGTRSDVYPVLAFGNKGDRADFTLDLSAPVPKNAKEPVLFEIREIHEALEQGFGYSVLVNGREVYFRTYEQIASAPNHYFISVDRASLGDLSKVSVSIVSECNTSFAVSALWAYTNFSELTAEQGIYQNLGLYLYGANDVQTASEKLEPYKKYNYDLFDLGVMFRLDYLNISVETALEQLNTYLSVSESWKVPVQIMPAMYWSSSPYGPDGAGGSFTDIQYSQVIYDSATGTYYDTTPNVYSSTNWVTTGNDRLNLAAVEKLKAIFSRYADNLALKNAKGELTQQLQYVMEWGVCYKGIGTLTGVSRSGKLDGGDFNPGLIEKAKADGVKLDPSDGLSYEEKLWLTDWHAKYNQMLAGAYHEALASDPVAVQGSNITLPTSQQTDHIFSHNVQWMNQNPSHDLRISGWMSGIGSGFYSSSEDMYFDDIRYYQYKTAYGRTGCVNLEMAIHNSSYVISKYLRQSYEQGLEFVTLFNDKSSYGTAETLKALDQIATEKATAPKHYPVNLVNVDFCRDVANTGILSNTPAIVASSGVRLNTNDGKLEMTGAGTSSLTFRVSDDGRAFENGLTLALQGRIGDVTDKINVYVGDSTSDMTLAGTFRFQEAVDRFNDNCLNTFDLTSLTKGKTGCYVKIEMVSPRGGATLQFVKIYLNFAKTTGQTDGSLPTMREERIRNLWISSRAVAQNQYDAYLEKNGRNGDIVSQTAGELMERGYIRTAYTLLCGQYSELLPASYAIKDSAETLGRYPISVQLSRASLSANFTLTSFGTSGISFRLVCERAGDVSVTISELAEGSCWKLTQNSYDTWSLLPAAAGEEGAIAVTDGKLTFTVKATLEPEATYTTVSGRAYSNQSGQQLQLTVQDPAISHYAEYVTFNMDASCKYTRRAEDGSDVQTGNNARPVTGDFVTLTFNEAGTKVVAVESVYGKKTGVIRSFTAPDPAKGINGSITFTDGTTYELEYQRYTTKITVGSTDTYARMLHSHELAALLTPGKTVTVTYCPESINGSAPRLLSVSDR